MTNLTAPSVREGETLNLTPTWPQAMQIIILGLEHGDMEGKRIAKNELYRIAEYLENQAHDKNN